MKHTLRVGDVVKLRAWDTYIGIVIALDVDGANRAPNVVVKWSSLERPVDYKEGALERIT